LLVVAVVEIQVLVKAAAVAAVRVDCFIMGQKHQKQ
jgi:hypothetical protein